MHRLFASAVPAALALPLLVPSAPGVELVFAPADGLVLAKSGTYSVDFVLDDMALEVNGEEVDLPEMDAITNASGGSLVVTDTYGGASDGRFTRMTRTFVEATEGSRSTGGPEDVDEESESPLVGLTVVFTWDEDGEEYTVAFGEEDADEDADLLVDLEPGIDFAQLLPEGEVEEGESWTLDAGLMSDVLETGGDLKFDDEPDGPQEELIDEAVDENLEGEITCTYEGMRTVDGREVAVVSVAVDAQGEAESDGTEDVGESGFEVAMERRASVELEFAGELLWDVEANHFVSFELSGDLVITMEETGTADFDGNELVQSSTMTFAGEFEMEFSAEAE
jgi:hypothetical protein